VYVTYKFFCGVGSFPPELFRSLLSAGPDLADSLAKSDYGDWDRDEIAQ
jgi:hypothetical protein